MVRFSIAVVVFAVARAAFGECGALPTEPLPELEARLARTQAKLVAAPAHEHETASYRELQEQALLDLERVQCVRESAAPVEAVNRGPGIATAFVTIPVLFITDRVLVTPPPDAASFFGATRIGKGVTYGRVNVRMPAENYVPGSRTPKEVTVSAEENSAAGVNLDMPHLLDAGGFDAAIANYRQTLAADEPLRALLFVHGFNVSYRDSIQATARLAWGIRLDLLPIAITWPSQGKVLRYWQDEQSIEPSTERLRPIIQKILAHPQIDEVIVVAHSMGSRMVSRLLSQLELAKAPMQKLTRIALAAADLNEEELNELWPRIRALPKSGWTFYTSSNDFALRASSIVHARPPVGDSRERVFTAAPADTVDATAVAPVLKGYGHSYVIDNPRLQVDLRRWMLPGLPVAERGLKQGSRPPAVFWTLPN